MPLADNDIKSELSYAYLHAVASRAGCICEKTDRLLDNLGVDARLTVQREATAESDLSLFNLFVQLKATSQQLALVKNRYSFRLEKALYNRMRVTSLKSQWLLIVLVLPEDATRWLTSTTRGAKPPALCLLGEFAGSAGAAVRIRRQADHSHPEAQSVHRGCSQRPFGALRSRRLGDLCGLKNSKLFLLKRLANWSLVGFKSTRAQPGGSWNRVSGAGAPPSMNGPNRGCFSSPCRSLVNWAITTC